MYRASFELRFCFPSFSSSSSCDGPLDQSFYFLYLLLPPAGICKEASGVIRDKRVLFVDTLELSVTDVYSI